MKKYFIVFSLVVFGLLFTTNVSFAATIFSDSFGTNNEETVTGWISTGDASIKKTPNNRVGSPEVGYVRIKETNSSITKTISTLGYENIVLKYYWRGQNSEMGDILEIEWKKSTDITFLSLTSHTLNDSTWSSPAESISLPSDADNTSIDIRFRLNSSANDDIVLIDDVSLEGDLIPLDTEAPVIAVHGDETVEATSSLGAVVTYTSPTATDNVDLDAPAICTPASGSLFAITTTLVTCNKTDSSGNVATPTTFNVIVQDTTAPIITLNGSTPVTMQVFSVYAELGAIATDLVDGILSAIVGGDVVDTSTLGSYVVTYNKTDANGNVALEVTRTVNVVDEELPSTTDNVPASWSNTDVTVTFSCTDNVECAKVYYTTDGNDPTLASDFVDATSSWGFTLSTDGEYTIKYFGVDTSDNQEVIQTADNTVKIDKTLPTAEVTVPLTDAYLKGTVEIEATATDTDGSGVAKVEFWHASIDTKIGEDMDAPYSMNWDTTSTTDGAHDIWVVAYDTAGNMTTSALVPVIVDNTAPVITLVGDAEITIYLNETYTELGATAMDDIDGDLTIEIITTDNFINPIDITTYTVTYTVTDTAGNTAVATRMVHVLFPPGAGGSGPIIGSVLGESTEEPSTETTEDIPATENPTEEVKGEVLGETTCDAQYLTDYLAQNKKNNPAQVKLLQSFLNLELSLDPALLVDGIFGKSTKNAVILFQEKYKDDILTPWIPFGLKNGKGTGNVYKTTKWKINMLNCPSVNTPAPQIP